MLFCFTCLGPTTVRDSLGSMVNFTGGDAWYNVTISNDTQYFENSDYYYSRLTAGVPTGEPDGGQLGNFYTGDGINVYGSANEQDYANNSMKVFYMSNVYSGFSFAVSYDPNTSNTGATTNGQATSVTLSLIHI